MGYEAQKPPNQGDADHKFLEFLKIALLKEEKEIKAKYGIRTETPIYKDKGLWRFRTEPYQLLEEWKKNKDKYQEELKNLYDDKDDESNDLYHQK